MEALKTDIVGTVNVVSAANAHHGARVICISTHNDVYPINKKGTSKAVTGKVIVAASRNSGPPLVSRIRYENVIASYSYVMLLVAR